MAVLSSKATDGRLSFTKYVTDNKRLDDIKFSIDKGLKADLYIVSNGVYSIKKSVKESDTFTITSRDIIDKTGLKFAAVKLGTISGFIQISKIKKPTTSGNGTAYEDEVVDAINAYILSAGGTIDIKLGKKIYKNMSYSVKVDTNIKSAGGVKGDPKADIIICSDIKSPLGKDSIYISHKKEGGPEAFQQYGGLSPQSGIDISQHPLTLLFLKHVVNVLDGASQLPNPVMMTFKDANLSSLSIFGPDYGKKFSLQHTQLIGQGMPKWNKISDTLVELSDFTSGMSLSGDLSHFVNGYEPVFGATFRAGRGFDFEGKKYTGARVAIYPKKLMETRSKLIKFSSK